MAKNRKKVNKIKTKRKNWHKVLAPKLFANKEIGESYLVAAQDAVGRLVKINLREMTGSMKDQNSRVQFKITGVKDSALQTTVVGFEVVASFVKRAVRKNTSRIDDCFTVKTKTGQIVRLKTLVVARNRVQRSVRTAISAMLKELLTQEVAKTDFANFVGSVVGRKIQGGLKRKMSKLTPIKEVMLRVVKLEEKKAFGAATQVLEEEDVQAPETEQEESKPEDVVETQEPAEQEAQESEEALEVTESAEPDTASADA